MRLPGVILIAATTAALAGAGGAYGASKITGAQIKDGTITSRDVRNRSLAVVDLSTGARRTLRGTAGPAGPVGPQGAPGPAAAVSVQKITGVPVSVGAGAASPTATAACPVGTVLTGGGFQADPSNNFSVARSVGSDDRRTWFVNARNDGGFAGQLTALAYCAS